MKYVIGKLCKKKLNQYFNILQALRDDTTAKIFLSLLFLMQNITLTLMAYMKSLKDILYPDWANVRALQAP